MDLPFFTPLSAPSQTPDSFISDRELNQPTIEYKETSDSKLLHAHQEA